MTKPLPRSRRSVASQYANTGSFNRLAGRSLARGSVRPASYYFRWKIIFFGIGVAILGAGFLALIFK